MLAGPVIAHASCSRVLSGRSSPAGSVVSPNSSNGQAGEIFSPGVIDTLTIISSSSSGVAGMLLLAGTSRGLPSSIAAIANRSDCSKG